MRKNSVRKFIHAILDLLPLFVIPIFAIYSMNHEISGNSVNTSGYEVRNKYETNEVEGWNDLVLGNIYHCDDFNLASQNEDNYYFTLKILNYTYIDNDYEDAYIDEIFNIDYYNANIDNYIFCSLSNVNMVFYYTNMNTYISYTYDAPSFFRFGNFDFIIDDGLQDFKTYCDDHDIFPEKSDFQVLEYVYNEGIVLDDEDIMSQFVYVTYNAVDKYFNMGNVFNMTGVYDWFVVNIFGGNAPISLFIVWNVVLYEFVMDLLMLLYGLFMWFIDMIEKLMNKPLDSIK